MLIEFLVNQSGENFEHVNPSSYRNFLDFHQRKDKRKLSLVANRLKAELINMMKSGDLHETVALCKDADCGDIKGNFYWKLWRARYVASMGKATGCITSESPNAVDYLLVAKLGVSVKKRFCNDADGLSLAIFHEQTLPKSLLMNYLLDREAYKRNQPISM